MEKQAPSTSSLEFKVHPLVLINVSDHYTRTKANTGGSPSTRVLGVLLGSQSGRVRTQICIATGSSLETLLWILTSPCLRRSWMF